jgi:hypothetical protein
MKRLIPLFVALLVSISLPARPPVEDGWSVFAKVKFSPKFFKEFNENFLFPAFDAGIRSREGKDIVLKGHYLPMELEDDKTVIVSKFPYAACFFCGGAGPESVAEVIFAKRPRKFKADQIITIKGKLKLNDRDVNHMNFIITDAVLVVQ